MENIKKIHILIIDDDEAISRLFGGKLSSAGFEVLYAHDGNDGREIARRFQPDLILLDIRMPGTDGMTAAGRMKSDSLTSHIPIVFLTNEDLSADAEKFAKEVWVVDYIHKSIDIDEFVERVKKIMREQKIL